MTHYIFVETDFGEWRVVFPDVPGCEAKGVSLDDAKYAAASALAGCIREGSSLPPAPMDLVAVQRSEERLLRDHVDLSKAVVSMIPMAAYPGKSNSTDTALDVGHGGEATPRAFFDHWRNRPHRTQSRIVWWLN